MNKVYKVLWNSSLQCYTVVSELAKSHSKSSASKAVKAAVLSSLVAFSANAAADDLIFDNQTQVIDSDVTLDNNGVLKLYNKSSVDVKGNLTINHTTDDNVWNEVKSGSSLAVQGSLNMKGYYVPGAGDFTTTASADAYHRNRLFATGEGSSITVAGNTTLTDNVELFAETYSNPIDNPNHNDYIDKSTFKELGTLLVKGDVNISRNATLGAYNAGETTVEGNVNIANGGFIQAWDSDSLLTINGDVKLSGENSQVGAGRTAAISIGGSLSLQDNADIILEDKGKLEVQNNLSLDNSYIYATNSSIKTGGNLSITDVKPDQENAVFETVTKSKIDVGGDLLIKGKILHTLGSTIDVKGNVTFESSYLYGEGGTLGANSDVDKTRNGTLNVGGNLTVKGDDVFYDNIGVGYTSDLGINYLNVAGDVSVSDNARLFVQKYSYYEEDGPEVVISDENKAKAVFEKDALIKHAELALYNYADATVKGDITATDKAAITVTRSSSLTADGNVTVSDGSNLYAWRASLNTGGNLSVADSSFTIDNSSVKVNGDLSLTKSTYDANNNNWNGISDSSISAAGKITVSNQLIGGGNYSLTSGGDLNITNSKLYTCASGMLSYTPGKVSTVTVKGNLNLNGIYREDKYDAKNDATYYAAYLATNILNVSGDISLTDTAHLYVERYGWYAIPDPSHQRLDVPENERAVSNFAGNLTVDKRSRFGIYSASDVNLSGDLNLASGGDISVWGDSSLSITGNLTAVDKDTRLTVGDNSSLTVSGNASFKNGAALSIEADTLCSDGSTRHYPSSATITGNVDVEDGSRIYISKDSSLNVKGNLNLDKGAVLETNDAGSVSVSLGGKVTAAKDVLLNSDYSDTAEKVAEKTFKLDTFSKLTISDLEEVSVDKAIAIKDLLLTDNSGLLDIKIKVDEPDGADTKVSVDNAIKAVGTTACKSVTVSDIDTSSATLSELAGSSGVLSWGSAQLKAGQDQLKVGTAALELNKTGKSGLFVQTADGKAASVNLEAGGALSLNGSGTLANITGNGTVHMGLESSDSTALINVQNVGDATQAVKELSVGSNTGSDVKVTANLINAETLNIASGAIKADKLMTKLVSVGSEKTLDSDGQTGVLSVKTLELASGGVLFGDPDFGLKASVEAIENLAATSGGTTYDGVEKAVLDGVLISGQNNILAVGLSSEEQARSEVASWGLTDENGSLKADNVASALVLNKPLEVLASTTSSTNGLIIDKNATADSVLTDADVSLGDNSAIVLTENLVKNMNAEKKAAITLDKADAKVKVTASDSNKVKILVGSKSVSTKSQLTGLKVFDNATVENAQNVVVELNSPLYSTGALSSDGTIKDISVNRLFINSLVNASTPVSALIDNVAEYSAYTNGSGVSYIFDKVADNSGQSVELAARLAPLAGTYQAAKSIADSSTDALNARFGMGSKSASVVKSGNTALWATVNYTKNDSSSLKAQGIKYGADVKAYGGVLGVDYTLADMVALGGYITAGSGDADGKFGSAKTDFDYTGIGLYANWNIGENLSLLTDLGYTVLDNELSANGGLKSDADMKVLTAGITAKYDLIFNDQFIVSPYIGVRATKFDLEDYNVTSGLYGVVSKYSSDNLTVISAPLGVNLSKEYALSDWKVIPALNLNVTYNSETEAEGKVQFTGVYQQTGLSTDVMDNFTYGAGLKLDAVNGNAAFGFGLNYQGSSDTTEFGGQLHASYKF